MRYRAIISYFGANYVGWQRQLNGLSVQEVLEKALSKVFGSPTQATASGRTDAGVHALGQVVHFDAQTSIPPEKIPYAVNAELPDDVSMLFCETAPDDFNARFSAKRKTYCYKLYVCRHRLPVLEQTHEHIVQALDVNAMREAAKAIEGTHDFKCFEASGSVIKNTVRTVYGVDVSATALNLPSSVSLADGEQNKCERTDEVQNNVENANANALDLKAADCCEICISVTGNGFLYNMVRIIAGTLVYVGLHKLTVRDVQNIIANKDRTKAGKTLGAKGLHLMCVYY